MIACSCQELSHNIYNKSAVKFLYKLISRCLFLTEGNPQLDWITSEPRELFRRHLEQNFSYWRNVVLSFSQLLFLAFLQSLYEQNRRFLLQNHRM